MLTQDLDQVRYQERQEKEAQDWEARCHSCGMCCGVKDKDPCEELVLQKSGKYSCKVYSNRFGLHKTKSGRVFSCVPLRDILHQSWPGDEQCSYKNDMKKVLHS